MRFNILLYISTVLVWGTSWYAILFQVENTHPAVAVFLRFTLAAFFAWMLLYGRRLFFKVPLYRLSRRDLGISFLLGASLFSFNYLLFYWSEIYIVSVWAAIVFANVIFFNMLINRWVLGRQVRVQTYVGGACGLLGLGVIFWPVLADLGPHAARGLGLGLALIATMIASCGNVISQQLQKRHIPVLETNAWGMTWGALLQGVYSLIWVSDWSVETSWPFVLSLFYLAFFASVIAFGTYLKLIGRIGADRAAYAAVLFPIVGLVFSYAFENYQPDWYFLGGFALVLGGNVLIFYKKTPEKNPGKKKLVG